jgi:hypothetical protein
MSESIQLHTHVWRVRAEIGHTWLTPEPLDCLRYAVTEAGEAMDAHLRALRPDDARNNERRLDVLDELGDCAIMLASALPADAPPTTMYPIQTGVDLDHIAHAVAQALVSVDCNQFHAIEWALACILAYPGMSLGVALDRLERIREKYL